MGRHTIVFDPPGYKWASEPGQFIYWTGPDLLKQYVPDPKAPGILDYRLFNPPDSEWLMPRPRQWNRDWYKDSRLAHHVVTNSLWTWVSGITPVTWQDTRLADGTTYPHNEFIGLTTPSSFTPFTNIDWSAVGAATGLSFPAGFGTIGFASMSPVGQPLWASRDYCPYLQWLAYPPPRDLFAFGFGTLALILYRNQIIMIRFNVKTSTWEHLGQWSIEGVEQPWHHKPVEWTRQGSMIEATNARAEFRGVLVLPVGLTDLYLFFATGKSAYVTLPDLKLPGGEYESKIGFGSWWMAAAPNQRLNFQCQVVGFETADTFVTSPVGTPIMFDLGKNYKPTVEPVWDFDGLIHNDPTTATAPVKSLALNVWNWSSADTGESMAVEVRHEGSLAWASDGTHHKGMVHMRFTPSTFGGVSNGAYLTPQFRNVELRFPVKLEDRDSTPYTINDTQFLGWRVENSLRDPAGKKFSVALKPAAAAAFELAGMHLKDEYPVHVLEDVDGDGTAETLRVAAWVRSPEYRLPASENNAGKVAVPFHTVQGEALLVRADQPFEYLPQLVDPANIGYVEHTFAVEQTMLLSGFDTSDATKFLKHTDPNAGTDVARLPGTSRLAPAQVGRRIEGAWAPTWDQTRLEYALLVARQWRGWSLYERLDGLIYYHPDLVLDLLLGLKYSVTGTIYRSQAEAVAAGVPNQYWLANTPDHDVGTPEGNVVRVTGQDSDGQLTPHVIDRDTASITDPTDTDYIGERKVVSMVSRLGVSESALGQIARLRLLQVSRRTFTWNFTVPQAPWHFSPAGLEVGYVWTVQARGDYLITHLEVEEIARDWRVTRITGEKLPSGATSGSAGTYPGEGV